VRVKIDDPVDAGFALVAFFSDPAGNGWGFCSSSGEAGALGLFATLA
jgi:hypothetical protein